MLTPRGAFAFYERFALDAADPPRFPLPWAEAVAASHLLTREATIDALGAAGLGLLEWRDVSQAVIGACATQPPPDPMALGLGLAMGPRFPEMAANVVRNIREVRLGLVMGVARNTRS